MPKPGILAVDSGDVWFDMLNCAALAGSGGEDRLEADISNVPRKEAHVQHNDVSGNSAKHALNVQLFCKINTPSSTMIDDRSFLATYKAITQRAASLLSEKENVNLHSKGF